MVRMSLVVFFNVHIYAHISMSISMSSAFEKVVSRYLDVNDVNDVNGDENTRTSKGELYMREMIKGNNRYHQDVWAT